MKETNVLKNQEILIDRIIQLETDLSRYMGAYEYVSGENKNLKEENEKLRSEIASLTQPANEKAKESK